MERTSSNKQHIESRPDLCGGRPCIAGTRIRVQDIFIWHEQQEKSADEIVTDFPELSLADVHAALAYFWDNRDEIKRQIKEEEDFVEAMRAKAGPGLIEPAKDKDAGRGPLSS